MIGHGFFIHDELDNVIAARAGGLRGPMHALDVESLGCRVALQWPRRNRKCVESDNLLLISVSCEQHHSLWSINFSYTGLQRSPEESLRVLSRVC